MAEPAKPVPFPDMETAPFWAAARDHRLALPQCRECGFIVFPPKSRCPRCLSTNVAWTDMSGRGTVYTFSVMHDTFMRGYDPPYVVAEVELEEQPGLRLTSNILDCAIGDVHIGMPVEVTFEDRTEDVSLPQFRPRPA